MKSTIQRVIEKGLLLFVLLTGCTAASSLLEHGTVYSQKLSRNKEFSVLRPPVEALEGRDPTTLPVFLLLHGMGDDNRSLDDHGVSAKLHEAMSAGRIPPVYFVAPDGERGFYLNWYDGSRPYEDYILNEVLPEAEKLLGVEPGRERRHIIGMSMGASGAVQIGLKHPELFASVTSLSGMIFNEEEGIEFKNNTFFRFFIDFDRIWGDDESHYMRAYNPYLLTEQTPAHLRQKVVLAYGDDERKIFGVTARKFHAHLEKLGYQHQVVEYRGGHGWKYWEPVIEQAVSYVLNGS